MKNLNFWRYILLFLCLTMQFSCDTDEEESADIFVYFTEEALSVTEGDTDIINVPIQVFATGNLTADLQITYTIEGQGTDRVIDQTGGAIILQKGFEAYRGYISLKPGNNETADGESALRITLDSPNPNVIFGLGADKTNGTMQLTVIDDECSAQIDVFSGGSLVNTTGSGVHTVASTLDGNILTLEGDLISYSPLNAKINITLTPDPDVEGGTIGTAFFGEAEDAGTDSDGFDYYFSQFGEGTYDACTGEIKLDFYVYYFENGDWVYWYESNNVITVP